MCDGLRRPRHRHRPGRPGARRPALRRGPESRRGREARVRRHLREQRLHTARKDEIVRNSREGVEKWMQQLKGAKVYRGHARFVAPAQIQVGSERLGADKIFLDVGGRPLIPKMPGLDTVPYLTNETDRKSGVKGK